MEINLNQIRKINQFQKANQKKILNPKEKTKLNDNVNISPGVNDSSEIYYSKLASKRIIFIAEEITKSLASTLSAHVLLYESQSKEDITVYLNSNGGDLSALANIYDLFQAIESPIKTICIGKAYSAAALLLAAGAKGKRFLTKNCEVMIHGLQCEFPISSVDKIDGDIYYKYLNNSNDHVIDILAKHTGHSFDKVKKDCSRDLYMTAEDALKYGMADYII